MPRFHMNFSIVCPPFFLVKKEKKSHTHTHSRAAVSAKGCATPQPQGCLPTLTRRRAVPHRLGLLQGLTMIAMFSVCGLNLLLTTRLLQKLLGKWNEKFILA